MPVNLRIVQGLQEAAEILASDRGAQLLGGGTLLVRAINEGTMTEGTLLRTVDPVLLAMNTGGARVELGAGVTAPRAHIDVADPGALDETPTHHLPAPQVVGHRHAPPILFHRAGILIDASSDYTVETILPGHYDDRPAQHIHYMITAPGHKTLVTQAYFATDPFFGGDPDKNYKKMASHRDLVRTVTLIEAPGTPRAAITFDICLEKA